MPLNLDPPPDEHEFLDWALDCAIELMEDGQEGAVDELLSLRPSLHEQVQELIELARKVAFGPKMTRQVLPGYMLLEQLGEGGMGTVWLARQKSLGNRLVAVKILSGSLGLSPRARSRFRTEAQAIGKLRHPHIVDVYDVIEADGVHAYAMEWVEGSTLTRVVDCVKGVDISRHGHDSSMNCVREALGISTGGIQTATDLADRNYVLFVCRVGLAISRALGAVHRAGLVHRDVKPSNILLRRDGTPLLSDFGLVRDPDSTIVTQVGGAGSGEFAGTAAFAAPEQLRADGGEIDGRADIYSLGATLYSALALRTPFEGCNHIEVLRRIQIGLAPPLRKFNSKLPRDLQTIVAKAMDLDPARRYQTADELADDLDRLLNLQPIKAKPASLATRALKLVQRNRAALVAATLGGALTIAAVTMALLYFIGFPKWSKAHLYEARLVLLDPEQSNALFSALFFQQKRASGSPITPESAAQALEQYDAAARFAPFDDDLALERELVRLAAQITQRPAPAPVKMHSREQLTLTIAFASTVDAEWRNLKTDRQFVRFDEAQLRAASLDDLRFLGLLAMLCGEPETTMDAWTAFDLKGHPDPMIEASFGIVYLVAKQYGRAYPRLRNAVAAFPNVGFLTVYLAEAAAKCGDLEQAQRWLDAARTMSRLDRFNGLTRVQAGLHVAAGHLDQARAAYELLFAEKQNIVAFDEYVRFLESQGDIEPAMLVYLRLVQFGTNYQDAYQRFVGATERWWAGLDEADRRSLIQAYEPWTEYRTDRNGILPTYIKCIRDLGGEPPADGIPRPPMQGH